jgi:hypothetical protein
MTTYIVIWLICGVITMVIGQKKNIHPFGSFVLGAVLGLIGIVIIILLPTELPKAPKGMIAVKCSRCNTVQNVTPSQATFQCWQCKTTEPMSKAMRS